MNTDYDIPVVGHQALNQNEQRALGGFFVESDYDKDEVELIQVEVPVGCQRVAQAFNKNIQTNLAVSEVLSTRSYSEKPNGFYDEKELSNQFGTRMSIYTTKIDAVIITTDRIYITEIKTRNQRISGLHDVNSGFGQVIMNRDRFEEDYPSIAEERELTSLLLAEDSDLDITLIQNSLTERNIRFFDPRRGGFLVSS